VFLLLLSKTHKYYSRWLSTSTNKNMVVVNDEVTSFKQYSEESLMEAWYKMQENVENGAKVHTQGVIIKNAIMK
jgi:hypothetical protein